MLKYLGALGLAAFAAGAILALITILNTPPAYGGTYSDATVVKVSIGEGHGSGVYIGNNEILTAAHVAKEGVAAGFTVKDLNGNEVHAVVLWFNEVADVGLLKLDAPLKNAVPVPLACKTPDVKIGDYVKTIGYPLALDRIHTWGRAASEVLARDGAHGPGQVNFIADLTTAPGNSGGPLFDIAGNLAGITVASVVSLSAGPFGVVTSFTMLTYIIPKSVICRELATELASKHTAPVKAEPTTEGTL
jgi:S1-C subfamily serine protease